MYIYIYILGFTFGCVIRDWDMVARGAINEMIGMYICIYMYVYIYTSLLHKHVYVHIYQYVFMYM
jgi:hypothetical protein